jgi:dUTP pyrophosphatase
LSSIVSGNRVAVTMENVEIGICRTESGRELPLPEYMTPGAAGMDIYAAVTEKISIAPGGRALIPTGLRVALPVGYEAQIRPRSGLAVKHGVTLLNAPGTIDSDYRGEIKVIVINHGDEPFIVKRGDRIAQMIIQTVSRAVFIERASLEDTSRGHGGFGHTGV